MFRNNNKTCEKAQLVSENIQTALSVIGATVFRYNNFITKNTDDYGLDISPPNNNFTIRLGRQGNIECMQLLDKNKEQIFYNCWPTDAPYTENHLLLYIIEIAAHVAPLLLSNEECRYA